MGGISLHSQQHPQQREEKGGRERQKGRTEERHKHEEDKDEDEDENVTDI